MAWERLVRSLVALARLRGYWVQLGNYLQDGRHEYLLTFGVRLPADEQKPSAAAQIDLSDADDGAKGRKQARQREAAPEASSAARPAAGAVAATSKAEGGVVPDSDEEGGELLPEDLPPYPELPPPRIEDELDEALVQACTVAKEAANAALEEGDAAKALGKLTE
ncbi:unnamed protein product, partial [Prorocentrum cordatum]